MSFRLPEIFISWQSTGCRQRHLSQATFFSCTFVAQLARTVCTVTSHTCVAKTLVHLCLMKNTSSLPAMSFTVQHATPTTDTSSSSSPVPRSLSHCADLRPLLTVLMNSDLPQKSGICGSPPLDRPSSGPFVFHSLQYKCLSCFACFGYVFFVLFHVCFFHFERDV